LHLASTSQTRTEDMEATEDFGCDQPLQAGFDQQLRSEIYYSISLPALAELRLGREKEKPFRRAAKRQTVNRPTLFGAQIRVFAIELVVLESDVDIFIALIVTPGRAFIDELVFRACRCWGPENRLNLLLRCLFVDLIVIGAIDF
jgi:hypothetical protein